MTQNEERLYLIKYLLAERPDGVEIKIPKDEENRKRLLRSLFNVRPPKPCSDEFLTVQNDYLKGRTEQKGITEIRNLKPIKKNIYLFKGDITTLKCDAIVNAANSQMLGCFLPCHGCIDNCIHTFAGVELRQYCYEIMRRQGHPEPTGQAKITPAFNLPSSFVLHTVGPIVGQRLTRRDEESLCSCYNSCLELAEQNGLKSIAFCCISTGEFHFPQKRAAEIAVQTVEKYIDRTKSKIKVIFNVFKQTDYEIYREILE